MKNLIEIEGRYYKECNVVILPTNDKTDIIVGKRNKIYHNSQIPHFNYNKTLDYNNWNYQHLYITNDDEIKELNWSINLENNHVFQATYTDVNSIYAKNSSCKIKGICKKIIATTDKTLIINENYKHNPYNSILINSNADITRKPLPQPSQSFIKKYCELGGIDKVLVEVYYPAMTYRRGSVSTNDLELIEYYKLKIDSHNTITIKAVKDSWSREEVEQILFNYAEYNALLSSKQEVNDFNNYIKENL